MLEETFSHMKKLLEPPFTWNWASYVKHEAERLAIEYPELASLPAMIGAHYAQLKAASGER